MRGRWPAAPGRSISAVSAPGPKWPGGERRAQDGLLLRGLVLHPGQRAERAHAADEGGVAARVGDAVVDREQASCRRGVAADHAQRGGLALRRVPAQTQAVRRCWSGPWPRWPASGPGNRGQAEAPVGAPWPPSRSVISILPVQGHEARGRAAVRDERGRGGPLVLHRLRQAGDLLAEHREAADLAIGLRAARRVSDPQPGERQAQYRGMATRTISRPATRQFRGASTEPAPRCARKATRRAASADLDWLMARPR